MNNLENNLWIDEPVDPNKEERLGKVREIGAQAVWSLSSCKPGMIYCHFCFSLILQMQFYSMKYSSSQVMVLIS